MLHLFQHFKIFYTRKIKYCYTVTKYNLFSLVIKGKMGKLWHFESLDVQTEISFLSNLKTENIAPKILPCKYCVENIEYCVRVVIPLGFSGLFVCLYCLPWLKKSSATNNICNQGKSENPKTLSPLTPLTSYNPLI